MRKLTIKKRIQQDHIDRVEALIRTKLPHYFKEILLTYGGSQVIEDSFYDHEGQQWHIATFWNYDGIYGLTKEFTDEGFGLKVAFAHDRGGWSYCLSLDPEDYNVVYVYRFTDHAPEEAFLKIADSFEEFINKLEPERQDQ